jgi:hypothetical protein
MNHYGNFPFSHLQLKARTYNALYADGYRTITDVENGILNAATEGLLGANSKSFEDVAEAVEALTRVRSEDGSVDWNKYWETRNPVLYRIAITTAELERLNALTRGKFIGELNLKKAVDGLKRLDIRTVGELVDAARNGIDSVPAKNFGKLAQNEVVDALLALSASTDTFGEVDWLKFADSRGLPVFPKEVLSRSKMIEQLPEICGRILEATVSKRDQTIFKCRLLRPVNKALTLEAIGEEYGLTRERVRQIEAKLLRNLREPILNGNYAGILFRLRDEFVELIGVAQSHLIEIGAVAWRESQWVSEIATVWEVEEKTLLPYKRLIQELLGYESRESTIRDYDALVHYSSLSTKAVNQYLQVPATIHSVMSETVKIWDEMELAAEIRSRCKLKFTADDLPEFLPLCPSVEPLDAGYYRLKLEYVKGRSSQVYWMLEEHSEPLKKEDILRKLNARLPEKKRLTRIEQLSAADPRVITIAKSGSWALKEWGHDVRTIIEILRAVLDESGEPLGIDEIISRANSVRSIPENSIIMTLYFRSDEFTRVGADKYARRVWKLPEYQVKRTRKSSNRKRQVEKIEDAAVNYLGTCSSHEALLRDVVRHLEEKDVFHRMSIYGALKESDLLESVAVDGKRHKILRKRGERSFDFPNISSIADTSVGEECRRAVEKLNVENVDIALFMFGRLFEDAMINLVNVAETSGKIPVSDWAKQKLHNRVEWAINHGVFTDPSTARLLKTERNNRSHGVPSLEERESLMKFAPYLSELYVDYLVLIESKILEVK